MNKWGIVVCTYGNSEQRLTMLLESLKKTNIPYDLWVRGSVHTYQQELVQRDVCERFGGQYMESARYRVYEPTRAIRIVQNPYIAILKDDIVMGDNWLEAMDYFWENNEKVGCVGWSYVQAEELVRAGIWEKEDDFWTKPMPDMTRREIIERIPNWAFRSGAPFATGEGEVTEGKYMVDARVPMDEPTVTDCPCPMAWTLKREDFVRFDGFWYVGPGDNSAMYADLCWDDGLICVNIPFPVIFHRRQTSSKEYCEDHGLINLGYDPQFWWTPRLDKEYRERWGGPTWVDRRIFTMNSYVLPLTESGFMKTLQYWIPA